MTPISPRAIELSKERKERGSISGTISELGTGLIEGVKEDPFVALAMKGLSEIEGADPAGIEEIRRKTAGSTAAQFGRFVGEFGPSLLFGVATYGSGFLAGRAAIQGIAKQVALKDAVRTSLRGAGRAMTRSELSSGAYRAPQGLIKKQLDRVARKATDTAEHFSGIQGTPGIQAAAERAGGAIGIGSGVTAQELARGKSPTEALKTGALATVLAGSFDAALVGGARLLFRGARSQDVAALEKAANAKGIPKRWQDLVNKDTQRVEKLRKELTSLLGTDKQQLELEGILKPRAERSKEILATEKGQDIVRQLRATKTARKAHIQMAERPGTHPFSVDGPPSHTSRVDKILQSDLFQRLVIAPESNFGGLGVAANKIFTPLKAALVKSRGEEQASEIVWNQLGESVRKAAGIERQEWKRGFGRNLDLAHAWESGSADGVRDLLTKWGRSNKDIETVIAGFKTRKANDYRTYVVRGKAIGAKPIPDDIETAYGVKEWVTQSGRDYDYQTLFKRMTKKSRTNPYDGQYTEAEAHRILRARAAHLDPDMVNPKDGVRINEPVRNGPLEFNRVERGTTKEKIERGLPLDPNIWNSGYLTERAAIRRINTDPILGGAVNTQKGRIIGGSVDDFAAMVKAEGFPEAQFRTVIDSLVGRTYYDELMRKWATAFTSFETALKLPLAFLANATQPTLTATWLGYRNSARGALELAKKENRQVLAQAMSVHEHIGRAVGRSMDDEGIALTGLEKLADIILRYTGFTGIEKFNRIHGAASTQVMIRDRLARGAEDRLRGVQLDTTRKMFGEIGLDFNQLVRGLKAAKGQQEAFFNNPQFLEQELNAMIQGAQKTQFFPGPTRTPALWGHPLARTILQFKTFALGQSRFMRDAVLNEYSHGNVVPLATFLSASPVAGEAVGDIRAFIRDKERTDSGWMRGLHNVSYVGGGGIVMDLIIQAKNRRSASFVLGPVISDLLKAGEVLLSGEFGEFRTLYQRTPAYQYANFLVGGVAGTGEEIMKYLDSADSEGETKTMVDVGRLLTDRAQNKR